MPWQGHAEHVEVEVEVTDIGVHGASLAVNSVVMQGVAVCPSCLVLRCWAVGHGGWPCVCGPAAVGIQLLLELLDRFLRYVPLCAFDKF